MRRFWLRVGTWALAVAVIAAAAAYAAFAPRSHVTSPGQGRGHQISTMRLLRGHPRLDRGVLTYSKLTVVQARQTTSFEVEVTDVGRGPGRGTFARVSGGRFVAPQDVPTGGLVSVRSICSNGLTCTSRSSVRQLIAGPGRSATWRWDVAARSPGDARILLVATSYRRESRIVVDRVSDVVHVKIQATPIYFLERGFDAHGAFVFLALGVLAVTGALAVALALRGKEGRGKAGRGKEGRGKGAVPSRADASVALTEPLYIPAGLLAAPVPRPRPALGWRTLLWLALADVAAGALVMLAVRETTTKSPGFAIVAGAVVAGALPLYLLPLIIAYLRAAPDRASVAVINVLLGWTYLGWVAARALAVRDTRPASTLGPVTVPRPRRATVS